MTARSARIILRDGETYRLDRYDLRRDPNETDPRHEGDPVDEVLDSTMEEYSLVLEDRASPAARAFWGPNQRRKGLE